MIATSALMPNTEESLAEREQSVLQRFFEVINELRYECSYSDGQIRNKCQELLAEEDRLKF